MKHELNQKLQLILIGTVLSVAGCGGGGDTPTPAEPQPISASTPATAPNGCFNLDLAYTAGTKTKISYRTEGIVFGGLVFTRGTRVDEQTAVGNVSLDGNTVFKTEVKTEVSGVSPSGTTEPFATQLTSTYAVRTGHSAVTTLRIDQSTIRSDPAPADVLKSSDVYRPGLLDERPGMAQGTSSEQPLKGLRTEIFSDETRSKEIDTTEVVRFLGITEVTVPAGTYLACSFESSKKSNPGLVTTVWFAYGVGMPIQIAERNIGAASLFQATSITVNGKNL